MQPSPDSPIARLLACLLFVASLVLLLAACGGGSEAASSERGGGRAGGGRGGLGGGFGGFGGGEAAGSTAIPVEVETVERREIADYIEANGTLEAENEVDIVARISGPIVELEAEEGMYVERGRLLARIDPEPVESDLELARVEVEEARVAFERAVKTQEAGIISQETYETAKARLDSANARLQAVEIQHGYTEIRAPFSGLVIERAIKFAEFVNNGQRLFRLSDFTPLLAPVQLPEKDLPRLAVGQSGYLSVEAFGDRRFNARVLRKSPVIDAATGTFKVTLSVDGEGDLRPGMFASVFLEIDRRENTLVIPRRALVLESVGDTVYVLDGEVARRREIGLGFAESDMVEVTNGLSEGERVITIGQEAVSDGTAVYVLSESDAATAPPLAGAGPPGFGGGPPSPEMIEGIKQRMKERGMSDEQIEERLEAMQAGGDRRPGGTGREAGRPSAAREAAEASDDARQSPPVTRPASQATEAAPATGGRQRSATMQRTEGAVTPGEGPPPEVVERIRKRLESEGLTEAQIEERLEVMKARRGRGGGPPPGELTPERLDEIRTRMKERGLSDDEIEERIKRIENGESPFGRPVG